MKNNLTCYICNEEITIDSNIAKIIEIKQIQQDNNYARKIEYINNEEEIYVHLGCVVERKNCKLEIEPNLILCPAKIEIENFNQENSRIIERENANLDDNNVSLIRSDILNFLKD